MNCWVQLCVAEVFEQMRLFEVAREVTCLAKCEKHSVCVLKMTAVLRHLYRCSRFKIYFLLRMTPTYLI